MLRSTGLTALLTLSSLAICAVAVPAPKARSVASISWSNCESFGINSTDPNLQCAYLEVPMDYLDSSAGNARLAVVKYAATAGKRGTIFANPGGPGNSGVQAVAGLGQTVSQAFQGDFDIVSWDPRGVGHTFPGPVYCFNSPEEDAAFWNNTVVRYINETISGKFNEQDFNELYSQIDSTEQQFKDFTTRCQNSAVGPYLKYIGTSSTVRDLVSLGDAIVGQGELIDFWGISYGSLLGFSFVNMFPERAGRVILDGIVDSTAWLSYKLFHSSLVDVEKTYSGLADGCAAAGRGGCRLVEFTGEGAGGGDIKSLLNDVHDLSLKLYRNGVPVPVAPGFLKSWLMNPVLYSPQTWSGYVNGFIYRFAGFVLQTSQARNITIDGIHNYIVPSGDFTISESLLREIGALPSPNLTSYTQSAISGADNFNDGDATIRDVFDMIVNNTREVTPTFGTVWGLGYDSYGWPVRSVERLPPYSPRQLKYPVLLIGNTADPATPLANAKKIANLLGDNAFLLEQLGLGHTSFAQTSICTLSVTYNYLANSTLPQGRSSQCPVDNTNLFPPLNGNTTVTKRSNFLRRWR